MSQFDYILQLAQEEEDGGHAENAAQLRAVPLVVDALNRMLETFPPKPIQSKKGFETNLAHSIARHALAPFAEVKP